MCCCHCCCYCCRCRGFQPMPLKPEPSVDSLKDLQIQWQQLIESMTGKQEVKK